MEKYGRYLLLERIATGGMAEVFRAAVLGSAGFFKQVAVKRIHPHLANDAEVMDMLVREAKIASELDHPNIIRVLDLGHHEQTYFIAMEFVAGQALHNVLAAARRRNVALPLGFSLHVVGQALQGLVYAHNRKDPAGRAMDIIHRDVSPQNVIVAYEGAVQLLDFGIARASEFASQTQQGTLRGKPGYFPPEMFSGAKTTQSLDTYGMAAVLFEALTLRRLRVPRDDMVSWSALVNEPVPLLADLGVVVPPSVSELLTRALDVDPARRFPTSSALADALVAVMREQHLHWGTQDTAALMGQLFPDEMRRDAEARAHHHLQLQAYVEKEARGFPSMPALFVPPPPPALPPNPMGHAASWHEETQLRPALEVRPALSVPVSTLSVPVTEVRRTPPRTPPTKEPPTQSKPRLTPRAHGAFRPVLGIDFGTTNTCASWVTQSGNLRVVPVTSTENVLPSVIWYSARDRFVVGAGAREKLLSDPANTIWGFKRFLGRRFHSEFVSRNRDRFPYKLVEGPAGGCAVEVMGETKSIKDLVFHVICRMVELAEADAGRDMEDCVLSVPAHYGYAQRQIIRTAAEMAGLDVRAVINEPTAAALLYARHKQARKRALIYDLGGGTFDATLIQIENSVVRVLATGGDAFLGGQDFDEKIAQAVAQQFLRQYSVDLRADRVVWQRLLFAAENAKIALSQEESALIRVPFVAMKEGQPLDLEFPLNRASLEMMISPLIERTVSASEDLLTIAGLAAEDVDETVLVGGQTRTHALRRRVFTRFKFDPDKVLNADLAICMGAATLGQDLLSEEGPRLVDVVSVPLWMMVAGSYVEGVIAANTPVPAVRRVTLDKRPVNPGPMTILIFEALESTSQERTIFGKITLEKEWLEANPGNIEVEFKMGSNFALHVTVRGKNSARTPLELTPV